MIQTTQQSSLSGGLRQHSDVAALVLRHCGVGIPDVISPMINRKSQWGRRLAELAFSSEKRASAGPCGNMSATTMFLEGPQGARTRRCMQSGTPASAAWCADGLLKPGGGVDFAPKLARCRDSPVMSPPRPAIRGAQDTSSSTPLIDLSHDSRCIVGLSSISRDHAVCHGSQNTPRKPVHRK